MNGGPEEEENEEKEAKLGSSDRYLVFAKQGSRYGRPARSKVITSSGTTTLV